MAKIVHTGTSKVYELISFDTFKKLQKLFPSAALNQLKRSA